MTTQYTLTGELSSEKTKSFISALTNIAKSGIEKIILEFSKEHELAIHACNNVSSIFCDVTFDKCLLDGFEIKDNVQYAISDLNDVLGLLNIFKQSGFKLEICPEKMTISSNDNFLEYFGADPRRIKKSEMGDIEYIPKLCTFTCDETFTEFLNAINKISHENVLVSGKQGEDSISVSIAHKNQEGNSFTRKLKTEYTTTFKVILDKIHVCKILEVGSQIIIREPIVNVHKSFELYNLSYSIAPVTPEKGVN